MKKILEGRKSQVLLAAVALVLLGQGFNGCDFWNQAKQRAIENPGMATSELFKDPCPAAVTDPTTGGYDNKKKTGFYGMVLSQGQTTDWSVSDSCAQITKNNGSGVQVDFNGCSDETVSTATVSDKVSQPGQPDRKYTFNAVPPPIEATCKQ